eukprot:356661_1
MELLLLALYLFAYPIICSHIEILPDELLLRSFRYLPTNEQSSIDLTNSRFHDVLTAFEEHNCIKKIKQLIINNTRFTVDEHILEIKPIIHKLMD